MKKPLLTFLVTAFNQERFVREAVEAALAQTYSPLEVILSDDCSPDATFEIMQKAAAEYKGPHQVVLNRNPSRLSPGGHLNRAVAISHGELIIDAAGDDISLPRRTMAIYDAWEQSARNATSIHSDYIQIDEKGQQISKVFQRQLEPQPGEQSLSDPATFVRTLQPTVFGCTHAFSKKLIQTFGELPAAVIHEDDVLALRSILAGGITYIAEELVKYRVHGENLYISNAGRSCTLNQLAKEEARLRSYFSNRRVMYAAFLEDLTTAKQKGLLKGQLSEQATREVKRLARRCSVIVDFLESGFFGKFRKLLTVKNEQLEPEQYRILKARLLPQPLLLRARQARNYAAQTYSLLTSRERASA